MEAHDKRTDTAYERKKPQIKDDSSKSSSTSGPTSSSSNEERAAQTPEKERKEQSDANVEKGLSKDELDSSQEEVCVELPSKNTIMAREIELYKQLMKNSLLCILDICIKIGCEFLSKVDELGHYCAEGLSGICSFFVQICSLIPYCCFCCYVRYLGWTMCKPCQILQFVQSIFLAGVLGSFIYFILRLTVLEPLMEQMGYSKVRRQYQQELFDYTSTLYRRGIRMKTSSGDMLDISFDTWEMPTEISTQASDTIQSSTSIEPQMTRNRDTTFELFVESKGLIDIPIVDTALYDLQTSTQTMSTEAETDTTDSSERNKSVLPGLKNVDLGFVLQTQEPIYDDISTTPMSTTPTMSSTYSEAYQSTLTPTRSQSPESKNLLKRLKDIMSKKERVVERVAETLNYYKLSPRTSMANFLFNNQNVITVKTPKVSKMTYFGPDEKLLALEPVKVSPSKVVTFAAKLSPQPFEMPDF